MSVQFSLVILLTPAYTAGAIAEEKERKTLPFLLATDLRDREIILGKLMSRLLNLTLFILTGLPILSILQFLGGVDPGLLLAGFAATGLTMLGLAALSMVNSVLVRRARDAIVITYVEGLAYVVLSGASSVAPLDSRRDDISLVRQLAQPCHRAGFRRMVQRGQPRVNHDRDPDRPGAGGRIDLLVPRLLRNYALFMSLFSLLCLAWAILRMRSRTLKEASDVPRARRGFSFTQSRPRSRRPPDDLEGTAHRARPTTSLAGSYSRRPAHHRQFRSGRIHLRELHTCANTRACRMAGRRGQTLRAILSRK